MQSSSMLPAGHAWVRCLPLKPGSFNKLPLQGLSAVTKLLCSSNSDTTGHAAGVVANLAACNQGPYHDGLSKAGAMLLLIDLLKCSLVEQAASLGALRNLTSNMKWQVCPLANFACILQGCPLC